MFDVPPQKLMPLSMQVASVSVNYTLPDPEKRALRKASSVLAGLAMNRDVAPVDPDRQMPLLARAVAPSPEDREQIEQARKLLAGDVRTFAAAEELGRLGRWPEFDAIEGWRWLRAAHLMLGPRVPEQARGSLPYLAAVARGFREADRHRPLRAQDAAPLRASDLEGLF
jgi:hypothetical protein